MAFFHKTSLLKFQSYDFLGLSKPTHFLHKSKIKKIILSFSIKETNYKKLAYISFILKLITGVKSRILTAKKSNINLKIRRGSPIGCKVILRGPLIKIFLLKILLLIFPNIKTFEKIKIFKKIRSVNSFSFFLDNLLLFTELESKYELFQNQNLPTLNITFVSLAKNTKELQNILTSIRYPTQTN